MGKDLSINRKVAGKRIFVTGATGFIGSCLARRLHEDGAQVIGLEHHPGKGAELAQGGITVVTGDIADRSRMKEILARGVDIVMHIAAWLRGRPYENYKKFNIEATRQLAEVCSENGVGRLVFASSIAVYGLHGDADVSEMTPLRLYGDLYGDSKIMCEQTLTDPSHSWNIETVIVRPGMVYGPASPGWSIRFARWAKQGIMPLVDNGNGIAYPIYIDNLIDLLVLCAISPSAANEIYNAVDDGPVTMAQFLGGYMSMIPTKRCIRMPGRLVQISARWASPLSPGLNLNYVASQLIGTGKVSNQKAKTRLSWTPHVSLDEGLRRTERWLREQGYL